MPRLVRINLLLLLAVGAAGAWAQDAPSSENGLRYNRLRGAQRDESTLPPAAAATANESPKVATPGAAWSRREEAFDETIAAPAEDGFVQNSGEPRKARQAGNPQRTGAVRHASGQDAPALLADRVDAGEARILSHASGSIEPAAPVEERDADSSVAGPVQISSRSHAPENAASGGTHEHGLSVRPPMYKSPWITVGGSLTFVLGLFCLSAWVLKRSAPRGTAKLPAEVVEVLGRAPLPGRQQFMQLVRCGNKLLLLAVSTTGVETLTEVTDPAEVDRLAGLCQQTRSGSASRNFHSVLNEFGRDRHERGFLEASRQQLESAPRRGKAAAREVDHA